MTTPALTQTLLTSDVAVGRWTLDPSRTEVRIKHATFWGLMKVKGVFTGVTGSGEITPEHGVTGTITVDAASIDTGNVKRDTHLRSADFFEVAAHPAFVLTVQSAAVVGDHLEVIGELEIKGVREPITLAAQVTGLDAGTLAVHITGSLDRHRFGVTGNQLGMITGPTALDIEAVFTRASA